jgi:hypothetical protein
MSVNTLLYEYCKEPILCRSELCIPRKIAIAGESEQRESAPLAKIPRSTSFQQVLPFVTIGFVALLLAVGVGWFIVANLATLSIYEFGTQAFYLLLIILGVAAAVFLFGVLRSTATLTGKYLGVAFEFGGPAALFAFVVLVGLFLLRKEQTDFPLTVRLRTDDGSSMAAKFHDRAVTDSSVTVDLGPVPRTQNLDHDGQVILLDVPFRVRSSNAVISLSSGAFIFKEPKGSYPIPPGPEPVITLIVVPKPTQQKQVLIKAPNISRITSGGTSDGHSPFCQPRTVRGCIEPQHGGALVKDSGGVADLVQNNPTRTSYKVVVNTPTQICIDFSASTSACETEIYIQGIVTAVEDYEVH